MKIDWNGQYEAARKHSQTKKFAPGDRVHVRFRRDRAGTVVGVPSWILFDGSDHAIDFPAADLELIRDEEAVQ